MLDFVTPLEIAIVVAVVIVALLVVILRDQKKAQKDGPGEDDGSPD